MKKIYQVARMHLRSSRLVKAGIVAIALPIWGWLIGSVARGQLPTLPTPPTREEPEPAPQLDIRLEPRPAGERRDEADSLLQQGRQAQQQGNLDRAIALWTEAVDRYRRAGDREGLGLTYGYLGQAYAKQGRYQLAENALRRRLGIARSQGNLQGQIYALNNVGTILLQRGNLAAAQSTFREALTIARSLGDREGEGLSLSNLGLIAASVGNYAEAIDRYEAALVRRWGGEAPLGEANTRNHLGDAYLAVNRPQNALVAYRAARALGRHNQDARTQFRAFRGTVRAYLALEQYGPALKLLEQYIALIEQEENRRERLTALGLAAELYTAIGDVEKAQIVYERAIALASALGETDEETQLRNELVQLIYE